MTEIVELDNHFEMTVDQTFERAHRDDLEDVIIIGRHKTGGLTITVSGLDSVEVYWALQKSVQAVFDG